MEKYICLCGKELAQNGERYDCLDCKSVFFIDFSSLGIVSSTIRINNNLYFTILTSSKIYLYKEAKLLLKYKSPLYFEELKNIILKAEENSIFD